MVSTKLLEFLFLWIVANHLDWPTFSIFLLSRYLSIRIYNNLQCQRGGEGFQTEARYLPIYSPPGTVVMEDPSPVFVKLPIANYAPHPFHDTQYTIRLHNFLYEEQPENSTFTVCFVLCTINF